ncbi:hypothetical protein EXIGLDRAFT_830236 [Exidia glandulosa HHB12029]|uniref:SET domain-containing protein n=1 Tax=Exidia glandulosa HHB12029 TaxID=1314781 RepID=A0A165NVL5_EXIGL|nr:hypothetical protein EXIGLDRAFT_830236 [Exidia glandulosa HHB12029]
MLSVTMPSASLSNIDLPRSTQPPPSAWQSASPSSARSKPARDDDDDDIELRQLAGRMSVLHASLATAAPSPAPTTLAVTKKTTSTPKDEGPKDPHLREIKTLVDRVGAGRCPQIVRDMLVAEPAAPVTVSAIVRTKRIHGLMELIAADRDLATAEKLRALKLKDKNSKPLLSKRDEAKALFAAGLFELAYARYREVLADADSPSSASSPPVVRRQSSADTSQSSSPSSGSSAQSHGVSTAPTSVQSHSSVAFPSSTTTSDAEDSDTHDLLAKLSASSSRALLPTSSLRHSLASLTSQPHAIRARLYAASACLDLGRLGEAGKHLAKLPPDLSDVSVGRARVGKNQDGRTFARDVPAWVRLRMGEERRRLERMLVEREMPQPGAHPWAFDFADGLCVLKESHAMSLPGLKLTARGYETSRAVGKGEVLAMAPPLACALLPSSPSASPPSTASRFSTNIRRSTTTPTPIPELALARLANELRTLTRPGANPELGTALCWATDTLLPPSSSESAKGLGVSDVRAAILSLVQTRVLRLPSSALTSSSSPHTSSGAGAVGLYFPAIALASAPVEEANVEASFSGVALVLRARRDMDAGEVVCLDFTRVGGVEKVLDA